MSSKTPARNTPARPTQGKSTPARATRQSARKVVKQTRSMAKTAPVSPPPQPEVAQDGFDNKVSASDHRGRWVRDFNSWLLLLSYLDSIHTLPLNFLFRDWFFSKYAEWIENVHCTPRLSAYSLFVISWPLNRHDKSREIPKWQALFLAAHERKINTQKHWQSEAIFTHSK